MKLSARSPDKVEFTSFTVREVLYEDLYYGNGKEVLHQKILCSQRYRLSHLTYLLI